MVWLHSNEPKDVKAHYWTWTLPWILSFKQDNWALPHTPHGNSTLVLGRKKMPKQPLSNAYTSFWGFDNLFVVSDLRVKTNRFPEDAQTHVHLACVLCTNTCSCTNTCTTCMFFVHQHKTCTTHMFLVHQHKTSTKHNNIHKLVQLRQDNAKDQWTKFTLT